LSIIGLIVHFNFTPPITPRCYYALGVLRKQETVTQTQTFRISVSHFGVYARKFQTNLVENPQMGRNVPWSAVAKPRRRLMFCGNRYYSSFDE